MSVSHESVYLCNRVADTSGLPAVVRLVLDPIARAAWSAANSIEDEKRSLAVLEDLLKARDEAAFIMTAFVHADARRHAIIADMKADIAKMRGETKQAMVDALTEATKASKFVVDSLKGVGRSGHSSQPSWLGSRAS